MLLSIEIYMGCTDAEENVDYLMLIYCGFLGMLKTLWFCLYANNLTNNYHSALNDYLTIEDMKERTSMRKHAFIGRILCCCMLCFSYFNCTIYGLISLFRNNQNITNENIELKYTIPSRCALEYFHVPLSIYSYRFICVEALSMMLTSTINHGNICFFLFIFC